VVDGEVDIEVLGAERPFKATLGQGSSVQVRTGRSGFVKGPLPRSRPTERRRCAVNEGVEGDRVERLRDWFELQLHFAEVFASKTALSLDAAVTFYTNLHRRLGFGRPSRERRSPEWESFIRELGTLPSRAERIECTKAFARGRLSSWAGGSDRQFGCFSFDAPKEGIVRIHFAPNDNEDGIGPLSRSKHRRRVQELRDMFAVIRLEHPMDARYVVGGSWLYNLAAYRRLFPAAYIESLEIHSAPSALAGGSWWGQFVDHDERIVEERARRFSRNLPYLDPARVWRAFPLPALTARAEVDVFHRHYASSGQR
jgi:hypothetical protein